jgi:hypothetical protein
MILMFLRPRPPLSLGVVTFSHATNGLPFPATSDPLHKPFLLILSIERKFMACILMEHIVYMGIGEIAMSTSVALPAMVNQVAVAVILLSILQTRGAKCSTLGLVVPIGSPR